jgi:hypothetical protein
MSAVTHTLQVKSHSSPDERRSPEKTLLELVHLDEFSIGRMTMQPGWTWEDNIKPVVHTHTCQLLHVYLIPPGHTARVVGDEPYVAIEMHSAASYGVMPST